MFCVLAALLVRGRIRNMTPLFATVNGRPWWLGSGAIFSFCAYALNGFQAIPQAVEERAPTTSLRTIGYIIIGSIAAVAALPHGHALVLALLIATGVSLFKAWNAYCSKTRIGKRRRYLVGSMNVVEAANLYSAPRRGYGLLA